MRKIRKSKGRPIKNKLIVNHIFNGLSHTIAPIRPMSHSDMAFIKKYGKKLFLKRFELTEGVVPGIMDTYEDNEY